MIAIKKAGCEDLDELAVLFDAYRQFYKEETDVAAAKDFLEQRLLANESVIFMALENNKAVGFTQLYPIFTSVGLQRCWLLNDLFIHEPARKKGIASLLLNAAKEHGKTTGSKWLLLETTMDNYSAQALYEKNGWEKTEDIFYQYTL